jgi:hypothetical protein
MPKLLPFQHKGDFNNLKGFNKHKDGLPYLKYGLPYIQYGKCTNVNTEEL